MLAMETEPPAPLQGEEELGERAATTPTSMAAAVMLVALPQAHLLAPAAHGAAAAVIVGALCSVTRPPSLDQPTGSALNLRTLWLGQVSEAWRNGTLVEMSL